MTAQHVPGTHNIGPEEIALRRRAGHVGVAVTAAQPSPCSALTSSDLNPGQGPSARVAVELSEESALALADAIHAALDAATALEHQS